MQHASETKDVYQLVGFCVALGAAGYKYYQYITASDAVTIEREREIISTQREQLEELREMTSELDDITTANATLLQDSDAQLRELEALLFPQDHQEAKKGTNTRDLLNSLAAVDGPHNVAEQTENSDFADLIIMEDYPSDEISQQDLERSKQKEQPSIKPNFF